MAYERDPVSVLFDAGARRLLERTYARPGQWVTTRLEEPGAAHAARLAAGGINVYGRDGQGRDRWAAGFIRAVYYQHKWYRTGRGWGGRRMVPNDARGIRYDIGRRQRAAGILPAGRTVRIMSVPGGQAAAAAVAKMPQANRIYTPGGAPGPRHADAQDRDW